ncbi:transcription-silencing protein Clr2-domain-containing protein [Lasiosphaeris hirsuta]|uniref:Transcription-silencing protein Clr2-domain-containing protein n=1 Tax=Lasiosphaeris hirsuta TaxID=260670 RepID=A0AA40AFR9_9PEZI|nr:transcription-silencing protein Clr2-domain-containing protein [Lasiosphaeris hirsuta]
MANSHAQSAPSAQDNNVDEYYPIYIGRSDGKAHTYPKLDHNPLDPKSEADTQQLERWEVIIAGHLAHQLAPSDDKKQYKLAGFPHGYELRCAVRKDQGRDYYLYGHPAGPKSNYRTPGDFVLHLLWLVSDSTDYSQCSCDICVKWVELNKGAAPVIIVPADASSQQAASNTPPQAAASGRAPAQPVQPVQSAQKAQKASSQQKAPAQPKPLSAGPSQTAAPSQPRVTSQPAAPPAAAAPVPAPNPPGTTGPSNVFRVGEMVWYKVTAWRLGLILAINPKSENVAQGDGSFSFVLAPLGHALLKLQNVVKDVVDMRPFLTFSVPNVSIEELQHKSFEAIDWQAFAMRYSNEPDTQKRHLRMQMVGLEASKMAARYINDSFSVFNPLGQEPSPDGQHNVQYFTGVYLGAEMVRVGDPLRVTAPLNPDAAPDAPVDTTAVMLVSKIQLLAPWNGDAPPTLQFQGNVFRVIRAPLPHGQNVIPPAQLGPAFEQELMARNQIERDKSMRWGWSIIERDAVRAETEVQGRFYVTYRLMNIIDRDRFQAAIQQGVVEEAQTYLNNRSHSGSGGHYIGRRQGRAGTVGAAVSSTFVAPEGMVET